MPPRWYRRGRGGGGGGGGRGAPRGGGGGGGGGGLDGTPPWGGVDILEYCEKILPLVENLWSSLQDEVYFMGGGAAGDLDTPSSISPRIRNQVKTARNGNFCSLHEN